VCVSLSALHAIQAPTRAHGAHRRAGYVTRVKRLNRGSTERWTLEALGPRLREVQHLTWRPRSVGPQAHACNLVRLPRALRVTECLDNHRRAYQKLVGQRRKTALDLI